MPLSSPSSSISDDSYLYICNGDTCKKTKVSQEVHDFVDLFKQGKDNMTSSIFSHSRQALADLNKSKACIYPKEIGPDLTGNDLEKITRKNTIVVFDRLNNKKEIIRSKPGIKAFMKEINTWVKNCDKDLICFFITFYYTDKYGEASGHANTIIVNKKLKTIEHFEPHGFEPKSSTHSIKEEFEKKMKSLFIDCCFKDYKFVPMKDICPRGATIGVQTLQTSNTKYPKMFGLCSWWSIWFMNVRMAHPNLTASQSYEKALKTIGTANVEKFILKFIKGLLNSIKIEDEPKTPKPTPKKTKPTPKPKTPCPSDKILNPKTGRCVKKDGKIGKELMKQTPKTPKATPKTSPKPKQTPKTPKPTKSCPPDKILNPKTGRCVKRDGKIGKTLV